jgi:hypothetical protein
VGTRKIRLQFNRDVEVAIGEGRQEIAGTLHLEGDRSSPRWLTECNVTVSDQTVVILHRKSGAWTRIPYAAVLSHQEW